MRKAVLSPFMLILHFFMFAVFSLNVDAQSLPNVQKQSVWASANIKIDGKTTEWNGKFYAYNKANGLYYTLSNDDKNLYLTVVAEEQLYRNKLIYGGLTLIVSNPKNNKENVSVTFPITDMQKNIPVLRTATGYLDLKKDPITNKAKIDAMMNLINTRAAATFKEIQVSGIPGVTEPRISIYNEQGIKTAILFDNNLALTYELAIPLKYIQVMPNNSTKLKYNIKLNGQVRSAQRPNAPPPPMPTAGDLANWNYTDSPTDFGGEYILAKK